MPPIFDLRGIKSLFARLKIYLSINTCPSISKEIYIFFSLYISQISPVMIMCIKVMENTTTNYMYINYRGVTIHQNSTDRTCFVSRYKSYLPVFTDILCSEYFSCHFLAFYETLMKRPLSIHLRKSCPISLL
jgi:hypothetical protein